MYVHRPAIHLRQAGGRIWGKIPGANACLQGNLLPFEEMQRVHFHFLPSGVSLPKSICIIPSRN